MLRDSGCNPVTLARERPDALFVAPDAFFAGRRVHFATLTGARQYSGDLRKVSVSQSAG